MSICKIKFLNNYDLKYGFNNNFNINTINTLFCPCNSKALSERSVKIEKILNKSFSKKVFHNYFSNKSFSYSKNLRDNQSILIEPDSLNKFVNIPVIKSFRMLKKKEINYNEISKIKARDEENINLFNLRISSINNNSKLNDKDFSLDNLMENFESEIILSFNGDSCQIIENEINGRIQGTCSNNREFQKEYSYLCDCNNLNGSFEQREKSI